MMSQIEKEFQEYDDGDAWQEVYQRLRNEASLLTLDEEKFNVVEARKPDNRSKNRYRDVSPYDHSRVILQKGSNDYINASFLDVTEVKRRYILTQGPLEHTAAQFWQMVWEQNSKAIVMLNRVVEKGSLKCHQYWPLGSEEGYEDDMIFNEVGLKVAVQGESDFGNFTVRWILVTDIDTEEKREVIHFHYTTWPDFGVPSSPDAFLNFLICVRESGAMDADVGPVIIHCSAGIGRSGTFCLVDSCLLLIEQHHSMAPVDVKTMLMNMRTYRMGLIQTADQLRFSYIAIIAGGRRILSGKEPNSSNADDMPPTPPVRTTSLSPKHDDEAPPLPPKQVPRHPFEGLSSDEEDTTDEDEILYCADNDDLDSEPDSNEMDSVDVNDVSWEMNSHSEEVVMEKTVLLNNSSEENPNSSAVSGYELRKRVREERKRATVDQIKAMKERQQKSEFWRRRRPYIRHVVLGISLLLGGFLVWRFYWRSYTSSPV